MKENKLKIKAKYLLSDMCRTNILRMFPLFQSENAPFIFREKLSGSDLKDFCG